MTQDLLHDLARAKVTFQLRTIAMIIGAPTPCPLGCGPVPRGVQECGRCAERRAK